MSEESWENALACRLNNGRECLAKTLPACICRQEGRTRAQPVDRSAPPVDTKETP